MTRARATADTQDNNGGSVPPFVGAKNVIINGGFDYWQRGTSFTASIATVSFLADRFTAIRDGSGSTLTVSQQTFTPGVAPVSGYEGQFFLRLNQSVAGTGGTYNVLSQKIEDVRTFAGQTVTVSFWAKASASVSMPLTPIIFQVYGSGGSATNGFVFSGTAPALTTSWQRFTYTGTLPSISGKTIGTGSNIQLDLSLPLNITFSIDIWGVQLEAGNVATPFSRAGGTLAGELQACQRYYEKSYDTNVAPGTANTTIGYRYIGTGMGASVAATTGYIVGTTVFRVEKRTNPTITVYDYAGTINAVTAENIGVGQTNGNNPYVSGVGTTSAQIGRDGISGTRTSTGTIGFHYVASAEL